MAKTNAKTTRKAPKAARTKKAGAARRQAPKGRPIKATAAKKGSASAKLRPESKQAILVTLMQRKDGASIAELVRATGWQAHSVRGAISGSLRKKLGLTVTSEKIEGRGRVYQVAANA